MKSVSFFSWIYHNAAEWLANGLARAFHRIGSGSVLQRYKQWAGKPIVQRFAWFVLLLGLLGYMGSLVTSKIPQSFSMLHELIVYFCFFTIVIHRREWGIALFAFYLPLLTYRPLLVLMLILVLLLFVEGIPKERIQRALHNKMNIAIGFFMAVLLLSSIASAGWVDSLKNFGLYYLSSLLLYFLILIHIDTKRVLKLVLIGFVLGGLLISFYAMFQYVTIDFSESKWVDSVSNPLLSKRVAATFGNPNVFAQYLVMVAPLAFIIMWFSNTWRYRIYLGGAFLVILLALVLTFSRGSWLALGVAGVLLAFLVDRRLVLLGIIVAAIGINFMPAVIMDRVLSIFTGEDSSALYRFDAWTSAFPMIRDYWLTGIGMDEQTFLHVYPEYMVNDVRVYHFHNIFLQHFVMGGILGLIAVLFLFYQSFRTLVSRIFTFRGKAPFFNGVAKGLIASLVAIAIAALTEDIWRHYAVFFTFWFVFALIGVLAQLKNNEGTVDEQ